LQVVVAAHVPVRMAALLKVLLLLLLMLSMLVMSVKVGL
jgi:hypothetical protein